MGAPILFGLFVAALVALDAAMLVSLIKPGDERKKMIVWKASTYTFGGLVGYFILCILENTIRGQYQGINPFTILAVTSTLYCMALLYFRKQLGD